MKMMRNLSFNVIFLLSYLIPLTFSLKLHPKNGLVAQLKQHPSCQNFSSIMQTCIDENIISSENYPYNTNNNGSSPPPAFLNFQSNSAKPDITEDDTLPMPFSHQMVVLPAVMKLSAALLVPCTKEFYSFTKTVLKDTSVGLCAVLRKLKAGTKSTISTASRNARKVPQVMNNMTIMISTVLQDTAQAIIEFSEHVAQGSIDFARGANSMGVKIMKSIVQMITSVVENTTLAIVEFFEHVVQGSVDFARGATSWVTTISTYTYSNILAPTISNIGSFIKQTLMKLSSSFASLTTATYQFLSSILQGVITFSTDTYINIIVPTISNIGSFITQAMLKISSSFVSLTALTFRFLSSIAQDTSNFIVEASLDAADWVQYYSVLWTQIFLSTMKTALKGVVQTVVNIPMWSMEIADITYEYTSFLLSEIKEGMIKFYEDSMEFLEKAIDVAPFLIRYEEDGEDKIALTPAAQMGLYVLSTIYATQPLWEQNRPVAGNQNKIIQSMVANIQTRFFPPRTLFFAGALARGLQQSSTLKKTFHPTVGVGAIINFGATALDERWINYVVSGWFISGNMWSLFGSSDETLQHEKDAGKVAKKFW